VTTAPHGQPATPQVEPTGVDYLALLEARRARIDGTANSISFTDLTDTTGQGDSQPC
jgi:hypothetical protein